MSHVTASSGQLILCSGMFFLLTAPLHFLHFPTCSSQKRSRCWSINSRSMVFLHFSHWTLALGHIYRWCMLEPLSYISPQSKQSVRAYLHSKSKCLIASSIFLRNLDLHMVHIACFFKHVLACSTRELYCCSFFNRLQSLLLQTTISFERKVLKIGGRSLGWKLGSLHQGHCAYF